MPPGVVSVVHEDLLAPGDVAQGLQAADQAEPWKGDRQDQRINWSFTYGFEHFPPGRSANAYMAGLGFQ